MLFKFYLFIVYSEDLWIYWVFERIVNKIFWIVILKINIVIIWGIGEVKEGKGVEYREVKWNKRK